MSMFTKGRKQNIVMLLAVATLIFLLFKMNSTKSGYTVTERQYSAFGAAPAAGPTAAPAAASNGCGMDKGTGLASSLLPREVASAEDFGQFAPEDILKGQNFLEPRDCRWRSPQCQPADSQGSPQPQGPLRVEQLHHCPRHHAAWIVRLKIRT